MSTTPEALCCFAAHSVVELTRETHYLAGKKKGQLTTEIAHFICSREMEPSQAEALLNTIRNYWEIEGGLHQRLDATGREDESRVRNRNGALVLGLLRRSAMSFYNEWREKRKNKRQSTLNDFYTHMQRFNQRDAFSLLRPCLK